MVVSTNDGQLFEDETSFHLRYPMEGSEKPVGSSQSDYSSEQVGIQPSEEKLTSDVPTRTKQVYFVRHGDTDLNVESSKPTDGNYAHDEPIRGWSQVSLNQEGRNHANKAAESVKDLPIEHIVASDLPRAAESARILGNKLNIPIEYDPGLRTWDLGAYTEQTGKQVHDAVNRLCMEAQDERPPSSDKYKGESFNEFKNRILGTVSGIIQRYPDKETLVVSHNSPERVLHAWTEAGQPQKHLGLDPNRQADIEDRRQDFPGVRRNWGPEIFGKNEMKPEEEVPWFGGLADQLGAKELWNAK